MERTKLTEDLFILSWLAIDALWIFDYLFLAIMAFLMSLSICSIHLSNIIKDRGEYISTIAALLWLLGNGFWVIQEATGLIPDIFSKVSIILALILSSILIIKHKFKTTKIL